MSLIVANNLTMLFDAEEVLRNVSFHLAADSRVGLVGPNGGGKTTLLRILAGVLEPTSGGVDRSGSLRVGYLPQEPPALAGTTLHESLLAVFDEVRKLQDEMESLAGDLAGSAANTERFGRLQTRFEALGGYDYTHRVEAVLTGLGFPASHWSRPLAQLSGGQRTRACLGKLLLEGPDLLLLDEPTNHLDLASLEWLERWLAGYAGALVLVSHDRYFLDRTTSATWEVGFASLEQYRGPYSSYVTKREDRFTERMRLWESQQRYIRDTEEFIRRNLAGQRTKEAQGRRTRLERFMKTEAVSRPARHRTIHVAFPEAKRTGDLVLETTEMAIGYEAGCPLMSLDPLIVRRGDKTAIVGANGIGKTTLIRTLLGRLDALAGKVRRGTNVRFGYLSQTQEDLAPDATAISALQEAAGMRADHARDLLGSLLLTGDDVFKTVSRLSGGQRSRVVLAIMIAQAANVLILDEPTNHLDIPSQEVLQQVLTDFKGTVLFVSHDRYLIDAVATGIWAMDAGGVRPIEGKWEAYLAWRGGQQSRPADEDDGDQSARADRKAAYRRRRQMQNELQRMRRRLAELEGDIDGLEGELRELHDAISSAGESGDLEAVDRLGRQYGDKHTRLGRLNAEWEQLSEELESDEHS